MSNPRELQNLDQRLADDAQCIQASTSDEFTDHVRQRLQPKETKPRKSWLAPMGAVATAAVVAMIFFVVSPLDNSEPTTDTDQTLATNPPTVESPPRLVQESDNYIAQREAGMQAEYVKVSRDWARMKEQIFL